MNARENIGSCEPDGLVYDNLHPIDVKKVMLAGGQGTLSRGSVVAIPDGGAAAVLWDGDTSGTADCILCDDTETGADGSGVRVVAVAYRSGHFARNCLVIGKNEDSLTSVAEKQLRDGGIYLSDVVL